MSVPAAIAGAISTVRVAPQVAPIGQHEPMKMTAGSAGSKAGPKVQEECSGYYGQKRASDVPAAYGQPLGWAPCGYLPQQLRGAYGATKSGLTGHGVSIAIMSEDNDSTARGDANRWARDAPLPAIHGPASSRPLSPGGCPRRRRIENALDIEAVHGMAPAAQVSYVAGNGKITGDLLLDSLYTVVGRPHCRRGEHVLVRELHAGPEEHDRRLGDRARARGRRGHHRQHSPRRRRLRSPLGYPDSDPWITSVGGTSLAVGARGQRTVGDRLEPTTRPS